MTARRPPASPGERMVTEIRAEMAAEGVEPDAKEIALLDTARQLVDRMDALERIIGTDGEMIVTPTGQLRVHPAVTEHRQIAATLPKVLAGIVVGDTATGAGKDPAKVRAARTRWNNRDRMRETQAARLAGA